MVDVRPMRETDHDAYSELVATSPSAMFTHSLEYLNYLQDVLGDSRPMHLVAANHDGGLCGALPLMARDGRLGSVLNSLPYFGSHGSLILDPARAGIARKELVSALDLLIGQNETLACTIIDSPFESTHRSLWDQSDFEDDRVCQMTSLPIATSCDDASEAIFRLIHSKTRNQVRKGLRQGYRIWHSDETWALEELHRLHVANLNLIGGLAKDKHAIEAIPTHFQYDRHYRVYCASQADQVAAVLLLFYFKNHVEYFMPTVDHQHRPNQALSALIFTAMTDSVVEKGSRTWNWGGTWQLQKSLHHFKARWGASDRPYLYATRLGPRAPERVGALDPTLLAEMYPSFYVLPYSLFTPETAQGSLSVGDINDSTS